jgi:rhodanese-related sulfurtransferase
VYKNFFAYTCLTALAFTLLACNHAPKVTDDSITLIDDIQLVELIEQQKNLLIIDVRPDYRYRLAHIPNAINIPLPDLRGDDPRFIDSQHIVVYADGSRNTLSHAAAKKLLTNKKLVVSDFRGGMDLWHRNDRKTESSH